MKLIDIKELMDALSLLNQVVAGRNKDQIKEVIIIVTPATKKACDDAVLNYVADKGLVTISDNTIVANESEPLMMEFANGTKVTIKTDV